ncbi:MAG: CARDB domain-containing protein [Candidatus ainarchaeum sp.]|nr:CARDB domain-containing protein [Candidatus ainarchaeum sp.]
MKKQFLIILILLVLTMGAFASPPQITQISYNPSPAIPGSMITVFIQIENNETIPQTQVTIELENTYPFEIKEDIIKEIGTINKYGLALTQFKVYVDPSAENLTYTLPIKITSKEQPNGKITNNPIKVAGKEPLLKVIETSIQKLVPGQEQEIIFTVKNIGTSTAYDIYLELKEDRTVSQSGIVTEREITPLGSAIAFIEKLEPKQETTRMIKVSVNREATLKNYTLPITISNTNSAGERKEQITNIGFKVSGEVDFDISLRENIELIAGKKQTIALELFNKGAGKAEFIIIKLETAIGKIEKPKQFIGTLTPNDVDSIKTDIIVNSDITTHVEKIKAIIEYQDTDATIKTKIIEIPIQTYSIQDWEQKQGNNPFQGIIIIIVIIIITIIVWKGYNIKIKNKKN